MHLEAEIIELLGDDIGRAHFLEGGFRMRVNIAADGAEGGGDFGDFRFDWHGWLSP